MSGGLDVSGNVTVDGSLNIGGIGDVGSKFGHLDNITTDISYFSGTTTVFNNLHIDGSLSTQNIDNLQIAITNKQTKLTATNTLTAAFIGGGNVTDTQFDYLADVSSDIQQLINGKQDNITSSNKLNADFIGGGIVTDTHFDCLANASSNIQTQIGGIIGLNNAKRITFTFDPSFTSHNDNKWGNARYQNTIINTRPSTSTGTSFANAENNGEIKFNSNGTYKIKASSIVDSDNSEDMVFAIYLHIVKYSSSNVDYFKNYNYNFFSLICTTGNGKQGFGQLMFEDYVYIQTDDAIQIRNKVETSTGSTFNFDNMVNNGNLKNYLNVEITKISDNDITT